MQPESKFVESNGVNHHYLEWGSPDNPSVVMFHAVGMCSQIWNSAAGDLARDYQVFSFDLRGHGDTEHPEGGFTFQQIGEDTAFDLAVIGIGPGIRLVTQDAAIVSVEPLLPNEEIWPAVTVHVSE